ncbi:glutathione S-transferase family protein [Legionella cardiaca]|uniref:Glutathione S-transferase family protein n=1 Tax=Legionella cardiaca TaxID=1071983 RepID=A0ABY8AP48_9GAMM|nr:glutathione S-transferase family protein [Legionella cardiaca]WED42455.1 glutathione S-transferase family protein [Legionella cardiaca]
MLILYSYPQLFGVPDNNPYGLKVDTFLRLAKINYRLEPIVDTKNAPRGQLPYIEDDGQIVTDSNNIIHFLSDKYHIGLDDDLTEIQKNLHFLVTRMLDNHLYWVMSYSRWQDERFWPLFKAEFLQQLPELTESSLEKGRKYNLQRYYYQGISRYSEDEIYQSGTQDLAIINSLLADKKFFFGNEVHVIDACCYGFLANIIYFDIQTPLKDFIINKTLLTQYTHRIRQLLDY